ncbi:MAG: HNH endonuclease [Candidatus Uhrbacteria bacterium]|nr:HNH endonuclease [Candidatus Uhrbacteria bacterium]
MKRLFLSEEHKQKIGNSMLGKRLTFETKQKLSNAHRGKKFSDETKNKMSLSAKKRVGRCFSEDSKKKMSNSRKGKTPSLETKNKMRESAKKRWGIKENRQVQSDRYKGEKSPTWKGGITKSENYYQVMTNKRNAMKKKNGGNFTVGEWNLLKKQYNFTCPMCGESEPQVKLTIDHIIPISKGGSNWIENIQPLCGLCNSKKFTKILT